MKGTKTAELKSFSNNILQTVLMMLAKIVSMLCEMEPFKARTIDVGP